MALSVTDVETLNRLSSRLRRDTVGSRKRLGFRSLDAYYDAEQRLEQLGLAVPAELREFVTIVSWPATFVDAVANRCRVTGFQWPGEPDTDADLWRVWNANDMDAESPLGQVDSLVFGRSYGCGGVGEDDDTPLITVESPLEMIHEQSPARRNVTTAGRFYADDSFGKVERRSTLYLPNVTKHAVMGPRGWEESTEEEFEASEHGLGVVPVVPLVNRARLHARYGRSEMKLILGLTDAGARALTLAQVATEVMGIPQRTAAGLTQADFKDPATGETLTQWEAYFGAVWATANKDAKFHQFTAADLANFKTIIDTYAQQVSGATGLPMRYFGQATTNPPSADGIRADEAQLVLRCENKNVGWGDSWGRLMRIVRRLQGKDDAAGLETRHKDPSTPTRAQAADAAVKLFQAGVVTKRQLRRDLGYSEVEIDNMEREEAEAAESDPILRASRELTGVAGADTAGG